MIDSNKKAKINFVYIELVQISIETKTFLANNVQETHCKQAIDDFIKYRDINLITSLIMNIRAESTNYIKEFKLICCCQLAQHHRFDIDNIDNINENIVSLWQEVIRGGG